MSPAERLAALRAELARLGVDGFLVPRADEHLGEYVPASGERLAFLSGFTGSAGLAVVLADGTPPRAALFTDGRYTTQAAQQTDTSLWEQRHITENPPGDWLAEHAAGKRIGYDPWLHSEAGLQRLERPGVTFVPLPRNPVDAIWADRPAPPAAPALPHPLEYAGKSAAEKREEAAALLRAAGEDAAVLADAHSLAWLLNLRGGDLENTPLALGFTLLRADASAEIYLDPGKVPPETRAHLGNDVVVRPRGEIAAALQGLAGRKVRLDPETTPAWFAATLREAGAGVVAGDDPVRLPRACKNPVEQQGARAAHGRDAVALARFLAWFAKAAPAGGQTELSAAAKLLEFRRELALFHGESFPAISGAGEHGAIVHYRVTPESDRAIHPDECYLIDSGGQFHDGTTDVTRTLWTGPGPAPEQLKDRYTRVLQGHLALAALRFPKGVAGPHLDAIARRALWAVGLDYDHGTGHGVGSFLSVHEGPVAFSRAAKPVPLAPGMILSDEPGYYLPGHYGIRIENLLLVREAPEQPDQVKPFLEFETLTLAPYDRALIAPALLTPAERAQVDEYHARVLAEVGPSCGAATAAWLQQACAALT
ncbi:aminopeptidase P family protein [Siccirubricoccus phaeus]|uniref:aminopeptidase P family protein n=1 Tax=Siccirubricoccus phaeus TaxID=2595053 RepID=UPI0011F32982|nr:aminopeptidase P family protein [Siccirubricoccus phaeus]